MDDDSGDDSDDSGDDQQNVVKTYYASLKRAWLAESNAPILLPFKSNAVERFSNLIARRDAEIDRRERQAANDEGDGTEMLLATIGREELNRMKYVLRSYLRTRIEKIQRFPVWSFMMQQKKANEDGEDGADDTLLLSEKEFEFAGELIEAYEEHAKSVLSNFPSKEYKSAYSEFGVEKGSLESLDMVSRPDEAKMVFMRMLKDVGVFQYQDGDETNSVSDLQPGMIFWCRFDLFKGLLESSEEGGEPRAELL